MKRIFILAVVLIVFTSCTGPQGETGPTGPEGPILPGLYFVKIFQQGVYTSTYTGQIQAALYNGTSGPYYTSDMNPINIGRNNAAGIFRAIINFDLSSLPYEKVKVDKAELKIRTNSAVYGGGAQNVTVHKVTSSWVEFETGWQSSSSSTSWTSSGGDFDSNTMTTQADYNFLSDSEITIELDPDTVLSWMTSPSTNYGMQMKVTDESNPNYTEIYSGGEATTSFRPMLKVYYYTTE